MVKKIVIVGAGPSGVLLAHYLLRRDESYQVALYDRRSDPRHIEFAKSRTYPISLNERGMNALGQIAGLEAAVRAISLEMAGTIFHQSNGKTRITTRKKPLVTLDRTKLVMVLLETLTQQFGDDRLTLHFNAQCTQVNLNEKTVSFQNAVDTTSTDEHYTTDYDLLVGADGAYSTVRNALLNTELFEFQQKYTATDYKSVFLPRINDPSSTDLAPGRIHSWRTANGTFVVLLHQPDGSMSGVILFPRQNDQVTRLTTPNAVLDFFRHHFPEVGQRMTETEAEEFLKRPAARILTIRCSRYHYGDSVLLIGDAAHSVSPSIGQGCNAAMEDAAIFNHLLDECGDDIATAIAQFTRCRKADAHALVELGDYSFPSAPGLFVEFVLREQLAKGLHHLFPKQVPPSLSDLVFESSVPYSEILNTYQGWITRVKKANEKFLAQLDQTT
jgi:kynurenine 3-monooxygenase